MIKIARNTLTKFDIFVLIFVLILTGSLLDVFRQYPLFGESLSLHLNGAFYFLETQYQDLTLSVFNSSQSPAIALLLSGILALFGTNLTAIHAIAVIPMLLLSYGSYAIARKFLKPLTSFLTVLLILLSPTVLYSFANVEITLFSTSFAVLAVGAMLYGRIYLSFILLALAALFQPSIILLTPILYLLKRENNTFDRRIALLPILVFVGWHFYFYSQARWAFFPPDKIAILPSFSHVVKYFAFTFSYFLQFQNTWFLLLLSSAALIITRIKISKLMIASIATIIAHLVIITISGDNASLLLLGHLFPFLVLYTAKSIEEIESKTSKYLSPLPVVLLIGILLILQVTNWKPTGLTEIREFNFRPNITLSYLDHITIMKTVGAYLQSLPDKSYVFGSFREAYSLTRVEAGYVQQAIPVAPCSELSNEMTLQEIEYAYVVLHPYDPLEIECSKAIEKNKSQLLQRVEQNGYWSEIHLIPLTATKSAETR